MSGPWAEEFAQPSYKWIGERHFVDNLQGWRISLYPGGIGFSFYNYSDEKGLRVCLEVTREDGAVEFYLLDAYYCGEWGGRWQKWQTDRLPVFPYEGLHGLTIHVTFSYRILKDGVSIPSRYKYRFATLDDFRQGHVSLDDFHDPALKEESREVLSEPDSSLFQQAYERLNSCNRFDFMTPFFTRGDTVRSDHPVHEIHRAIDRVIQQKTKQPAALHTIRLAMFDFDHEHVSRHLVYARGKGVEVECIGDWQQVSSLNASENIARLRCAGIPVYGVVRNDPCRRNRDIASMHTKFILFNNEVVHSGSYNLHFHLWGGNWENSLVYSSRDASLLYSSIYGAIRYGHRIARKAEPRDRYNQYYSFGAYNVNGSSFWPQDAIISEIANARHSITVCMFDLSRIVGRAHGAHGNGSQMDVIEALIRARNRGVRVRIIVNGMMAHGGPLPEPWDKDFQRPLKEPLRCLKDAWMEVFSVYYWESIYSPLHHKFAVIDGDAVITGSYNWYEPSLYSDEILTVTRDERIAGAFLHEAELILERFRIERE